MLPGQKRPGERQKEQKTHGEQERKQGVGKDVGHVNDRLEAHGVEEGGNNRDLTVPEESNPQTVDVPRHREGQAHLHEKRVPLDASEK